MLAVGTPGLGGGTLAMLGYEGTVPAEARPIAEVKFPPAKEGESVKERFEFEERC
jgi:hypothetical protein